MEGNRAIRGDTRSIRATCRRYPPHAVRCLMLREPGSAKRLVFYRKRHKRMAGK